MKTALLALAFVLLASPARAADGPEVVYGKFHRAIAAGDLDDMQRYATEAQRKELAAMSPAQKAAQVKMMSALMPRAFLVNNKIMNPDGQGGRLYVSGPGPLLGGAKPDTLYGTIRMVVERGEWKVSEVNWSPEAPPMLSPVNPGKPAAAAPAAAPARAAPLVGSTTGAPERKLGKAKEPCVFKPVMTAEDVENCR